MKYIIALILPICIIGSAHSYYGYNYPRYGYDYLDSGYDYNQQLVQLLSGDPTEFLYWISWTAEFLYNGFYDDLTSESIQALASGIAVNLLSPLQQYVPIDAVVVYQHLWPHYNRSEDPPSALFSTNSVQMSEWIVQLFCKLFHPRFWLLNLMDPISRDI